MMAASRSMRRDRPRSVSDAAHSRFPAFPVQRSVCSIRICIRGLVRVYAPRALINKRGMSPAQRRMAGRSAVMNTAIVGSAGEDAAARHLEERGFTVVARNYRYRRYGEIDLIARKDDLLVFVEVKTRRSDRYGGPLRSISERKMRTMRLIAGQFLMANPRYHTRAVRCRFDLVAIENGAITWVEDCFR